MNALLVYASVLLYVPSFNVLLLNTNAFTVATAVYSQMLSITALYALVVLTWSPPAVNTHSFHVYPAPTVAPNVTVAPLI